MEKNTEHEIETGTIQGYSGFSFICECNLPDPELYFKFQGNSKPTRLFLETDDGPPTFPIVL